jgi:predicted NAD-dependent protein-ADP-ribosyltransferase YbiA (DUF1768 family)
MPRCKNGTREIKKQVSVKKKKEKVTQVNQLPRCKKGTRRNKKTGKCEEKIVSTQTSPSMSELGKIEAKNTPMQVEEIYFNSKSKKFNELSNFYGGVEACYMSDRFLDVEVKELFETFESLTNDKDKFIMYLKELQPEKKKWTDRQLTYWVDSKGVPITGILSKLLGGSVKPGRTCKKRLSIVKNIVGLSVLSIKPILSHEEKVELMMKCLRKKYSIKRYKDLLLSTGDAILHEKPMRGRGDDWTSGPGGHDLLGNLLMKIRDELKNDNE